MLFLTRIIYNHPFICYLIFIYVYLIATLFRHLENTYLSRLDICYDKSSKNTTPCEECGDAVETEDDFAAVTAIFGLQLALEVPRVEIE